MEELFLQKISGEEPCADAAFETGQEAAGAAAEGTGPQIPEEEGFTGEELAAWEAFREAYPEITPENIPEDVFRLVSEGETPVSAMRQVEIASLKAENRTLRQKLAAAETGLKNRARTPGSMLGRVPAPEDAFLSGLGE